MTAFCTVEREDQVLIVTMNRPEKLNAFTPSSHPEMAAIWDEFVADAGLRVGILTGAGDRAFSVGSDLTSYQQGFDGSLPASGGAGLTTRLGCPKPIIAAVNGYALGGGLEVMVSCDLAVASENAEFALPEVLVGAGAFGGGIPRLCRKIPHAIALELVLTGRRMKADEAQRVGLVNRVVPKGQALAGAKQLARDILKAAPLAVAESKLIADMAMHGADMAAIFRAEEGEPKRRVMKSEDLQEGARAFFEKRPPRWQGR